MTRVLTILALALALASCRYTFLPLAPERVPFPDRPSISGTLEPGDREVIARLEVRRMPKPGYIELRWYREETLLAERSLWVEGPGWLEARLPLAAQNPDYHRLVVMLEGSVVLQLDLGTPSVPTAPNPPASAP
ncbi:MAG: hypothetical protein C4328_08450 [Meiothermus sp.]